MKKEKEFRINFPDSAVHREGEITDDGEISIIYNEESGIDSSKTVLNAIPKPSRLIDGTEVYQKECLPYWYCKIKDGRDEFMHLYFGDLIDDDILYTRDGKRCEFVTLNQKNFRSDVMKALENMPEEGFCWIPVYEPSVDIHGNLQYISGANVLLGLSSYNWEEKFQDYSPENGSRMASITTYFLLLLRLLKDGFATIEQLTDNSKEIGHYWDSENAKHKIERTGERQLGGVYGFAGNTFKIVKDSESSSGFSLPGGSFSDYGFLCPLSFVEHSIYPYGKRYFAVGLLELTK